MLKETVERFLAEAEAFLRNKRTKRSSLFPRHGEPAGAFLRNKRTRAALLIAVFSGCLVCSVVFALFVGAVGVCFGDVIALFSREGWALFRSAALYRSPPTTQADLTQVILVKVRIPRIALAGIVGGSLGVAGTIFQALFQNPMADPYVIGVSSGASFGAAVAMVLGLRFHFMGFGAVPAMAFWGALLTLVIVYRLGRVGGRLAMLTLLLSGIAVGSFLSAMVSLLTYLSSDRLHQIVFWLMGGFGHATWRYVFSVGPYFIGGLAVSLVYSRDLNSYVMGEETAEHLGVDVERMKRVLLVTASLLTGAAVAAGGVIGFVGLIVPHAVRVLSGPNHGVVLPGSALAGAALLILSDALARWVIAPTELPVGLVTAAAGGPFFIYLIRRSYLKNTGT